MTTPKKSLLDRLVSHPLAKAVDLGEKIVVVGGALASIAVLLWTLLSNDPVLRLTLALAVVVGWLVYLWWRLRLFRVADNERNSNVSALNAQVQAHAREFDRIRPNLGDARLQIETVEERAEETRDLLASVVGRLEALEAGRPNGSAPDLAAQRDVLRRVSKAVVESFERFEYDNNSGLRSAQEGARAALTDAVSRAAEITNEDARMAVYDYRDTFARTPPGYKNPDYGSRGASQAEMNALREAHIKATEAIGLALRAL